MELEDKYWRRNLVVCLVGSFTTIVAMTLLLPFLPIYIGELGVTDNAAIAQWSGVAYGAAFFAAALVAPMWGRLADRYGRKLMLVRASLGMAVAMSLMGMAHNVWNSSACVCSRALPAATRPARRSWSRRRRRSGARAGRSAC
jgi:MFS family permease